MSTIQNTNEEFDSGLTADDFTIGGEESNQETHTSTEDTGGTLDNEPPSTEAASTAPDNAAEVSGESTEADNTHTQGS